MHGFEFLDEIVLLCAAALGVILLFQRVKLPPVIGLIVTGLLLGPSGLGLVAQDTVISSISELGVVMLLFTIGLEFSFEDMRRLRGIVFIGGPLQVLVSTMVIGALTVAASTIAGSTLSTNAAILIGMSMALSSTAICIKLLTDRREVRLPHGRAVMGILIFQDIAVVPMMILVTLLGSQESTDLTDIAFRIATLVGVAGALVVGMRFLLPRVVPYVTRVSAPEVLILGGLAICFGAALLTSKAGISMALGAFIAGMAIAGSEEGHAIGKALQPMRDAFTSMFFLSVGLLVNIAWTWLPLNIATALLVLLVNAIVVIGVLVLIRVSVRTAVIAGLILAQVGEFSFVLASLGVEYDVITDVDFQHMLVSIIITMIVTPTLIAVAPYVANHVAPLVRFLPRSRRWATDRESGALRFEGAEQHDEGPIVTIIGAGVLGQNIARVLRSTGITYRILELNRETVATLRAHGEPAIAGDINDPSDLRAAGVRSSSVVVVAINDHAAVIHGVATIRAMRPDAHIIVRARYVRDSESVSAKGADTVVVEEFESSITIFASVLRHLGVDDDAIARQESILRGTTFSSEAQ